VSEAAGYAHAAYAAALQDFGAPAPLRHSGGSILVRPIAGTQCLDAAGPYPLFSCANWSGFADDLADLENELVSLVLVPDPFGPFTRSELAALFPDRCAPFKEHHVVELARGPLAGASRHHRRDAKRALARCEVELVADPPSLLDEWTDLYAELVRRHALVGETAFSRASFERQLRVPGLAAFRASAGGALLGAALWFLDRGVAYYHLAAYTEGGYANGAGYALVAAALEHFAEQGAEWASLGAGLSEGADDGLTRFKAGWTDETRTAFLCGRILAPERYAELLRGTGSSRAYFPGYRNRQR
jgi:hypothetical protein